MYSLEFYGPTYIAVGSTCNITIKVYEDLNGQLVPANNVPVRCGVVPDGPPYVTNAGTQLDGVTDNAGIYTCSYIGQKPGMDSFEVYAGYPGSPEGEVLYPVINWYTPVPSHIHIRHCHFPFRPFIRINNPYKICLQVHDQYDHPMSGIAVIGGIFYGPNSGNFKGKTNVNGVFQWTYTGKKPGKDYIAACVDKNKLITYTKIVWKKP